MRRRCGHTRSPISRLPADCFFLIFGFLSRSLRQWVVLKLVCRDWDANSRDDGWICLLEPHCSLSVDILQLSRMEGIRKLDIGLYSDKLEDSELLLLTSSLTSLTSLSLNHCPHITQSGVMGLSACTMLRTLEFIQSPALCDFSALTSLRSLTLSWSGHDVSSMGLTHLTGLQSLDLTWCAALTNLGFLTTMLSLQRLNLRGCVGLLDEELTALSPLTRLRILNLNSCCQLSADCVSLLPESLTNLDLGNVDLGEGVIELARLTRLRHLYVSTTDAWATYLHQTLPNCEIRGDSLLSMINLGM